jgi:glycosyltransferase involved in cell wall biosynthesis
MKLAILLAARDEEARLGRCLESLGEFLAAGDALVVADDGSTDATAEIARAGGATTLLPLHGVGRARAYRRAFEAIPPDADAILVAQADMAFPAAAREAIASLLFSPSDRGGAWGFFRQRIERSGSGLAWIERGNLIRGRLLGLPYGDQAVFVRRDALESAGGFPNQEAMEDLELALRLRRAFGRPRVAAGGTIRVAISDRHWASGGLAGRTAANWRAAAVYRWSRRAGARKAGPEAARAKEKG